MKLMLGSLALLGGTVLGVSQASADSYTVQSGDTLNKLAAENNTTVEKIALENNIKNIHLIFTGQELEINPVLAQTKETVIEIPVNQEEVMQPIISAPVVEQPQVQPEPQANSAKEWIAQHESGGSYTISNSTGSGAYGKYQLMPMHLKYGTSPEAQERAADEYVSARYGSWENAKAEWLQKGWY